MAIKRPRPVPDDIHWNSEGAYPTHLTSYFESHDHRNGIHSNGSSETTNGHSNNHTTGRRPLEVAIIGGGLAGAGTAVALSRLPNVHIKVYERSESAREVGALIGVMISALKSLSRFLSPEAFEELQKLLYKGDNLEGIVNRFWRNGQVMTTQISPHTPRRLQEGRTGRVPLHKLLLSEVPEGVLEYGKKVLRVETLKDEENTNIRLHFEDGGTTDADLVVAADGLYSKIRRQYHPDEVISYRGRVAYRYNFPESLVAHIKDLPRDTSAWRSNSAAVFLSRLDPGVYAFLAFVPETEEYAATLRWAKAIGKPGVLRLKKILETWDPLIHQVLDVLPDADAYPLQNAPWMTTNLVRDDALVFVGDSAHPTSGDYGGGCSFAFGDCRALQLSLWSAYKPAKTGSSAPRVDYDVPYALHLFNETRVPYLKRVKEQMGYDRLDSAYVAEAGDDDQEWIRRYREKFTINWWLLNHDVDEKWQEVEARERHRWADAEVVKRYKLSKTIYGD